MEKDYPDTTSPFAEEGTKAHDLAEVHLRAGTDPATDEMGSFVQIYLDYVRNLPGTLLVEQRVDFSEWVPDAFGTADAIVMNGTHLHVVDLKYGRGVRVDAEDNPQALCYALGALTEYGFLYDFETVSVAIVQPRLDHISEWQISRGALLSWADYYLRPAAEAAEAENAARVPGEKQCQFCKAKGACRALAKHNIALASEGFSAVGNPIALKDTEALSLPEIAGILPHLDLLTSWAKAVSAHAYGASEVGGDVPGYKLVNGRSSRSWIDDAAAEAVLRRRLKVSGAYTKKLITPAAAEKALGKDHKILADHCQKTTGNPVLAKVSDKRPALDFNPAEGFSQVA
jgi:hypothetical protein